MRKSKSALTPLRAIRKMCLSCTNNQYSLITNCPSRSCSLWKFRDGHNENRRGIGGRPDLLKGNQNPSLLSRIVKNIKNFNKNN